VIETPSGLIADAACIGNWEIERSRFVPA